MHDSDSGAGLRFYHTVPVFLVDDIKAATEYYRDRLGFTIEFLYGEPPTYASVCRDDVSINFSTSNPPGRRNGMAGAGPGNGTDVYVIVGAIDELYEELKSRNIKLVHDIASYDYGMREFGIEDPNGYRLLFGQEVAPSTGAQT
jgi:uncharacterized glyoxalase superfamily protein PhnB